MTVFAFKIFTPQISKSKTKPKIQIHVALSFFRMSGSGGRTGAAPGAMRAPHTYSLGLVTLLLSSTRPFPTAACPPIASDGTVPGTCTPGAPNCRQAPQCEARRDNAFMPLFHLVGNFTGGLGTQPAAVNDVSAVVRYRGVWHVFHQVRLCVVAAASAGCWLAAPSA